MKRFLPAILIILLLCSHDMYLKLNDFFLEPDTEAEIQLFNGTFQRSENVIDRNRMRDVSLTGNGRRTKVDSTQWYEKDSITYLRFRTGQKGTWVAGVSTKPRNIELSAKDFNAYLEHDGVLDVLEDRQKQGELDSGAVERYSKHVKTLFQVGDVFTDDWNTVLGYPIEFVPQANPYKLHPGHRLEVKLLVDGRPLSGQLVYAGYAPAGEEAEGGFHTHADGTSHSHDSNPESSKDSPDSGEGAQFQGGERQLRTDENGVVSLDITAPGIWYLRTIHLVPSDEKGLTHESNWATLTFGIGEGHVHEHDESGGIPAYLYGVGSLLIIGLLFLLFNRKS